MSIAGIIKLVFFKKKNMPQIFTFKRRRSEIDPYGTLFTISA